MSSDLQFIVLSTTKFGENSVVLHTLSKEYGRRSFLVRVGKKTSMAAFLPLNILEGRVSENPKSNLWSIRDITTVDALMGIRGNLLKNSMTLFMSEVLFRTLKDGANEDGLYEWCVRSIMTLNALEDGFYNYHIRFLLEFASALGFSASKEGILPFSKENASVIIKFLELGFEESMLLPLSGAQRNSICEDILKYLEFHTEARINVKSLAVLRELFS